MSKYIIKDSAFDYSVRARVKNYGDEYDPMWGCTTIELTKEDIIALLNKKVLETCTGNCEYGILIRMESDE